MDREGGMDMKIHQDTGSGLVVNFELNKWDLFTTYRNCLLIWCVTAILDACSTSFFMMATGPEQELNPVIRSMSYGYGIYAGPLIGKVYQLFALWGFSIITPRLTYPICIATIIMNLIAVAVNLGT